MRIGIDISAAVYGSGVSNYILELVKHLPQSEVLPFGFSLRRKAELERLVPTAKIFRFPPSVMEWLWNKMHLIEVENLVGPLDIYHSSDWLQGPTRAKKVTTIHDLSPFLYPEELDPKIVKVHTEKMKWVVKECDKIICVSQNTANDLKRLFKISEDKISVIYEAMPDFFKLNAQKSQFSDYLIAIGTKQPRKNIVRLVNSFISFKDKYNLPSKLIVVGEKSRQVLMNDNVIYTGYVSDQELVDLLAGSEALVYPSLYEGFGLPLLGAFHHKVPVACSSTSSLPEVGGDAVVYFDPLNEEAIAKAVAKAILQKKELSLKGTKQLTKFSWQKMVNETMQVYKSLL